MAGMSDGVRYRPVSKYDTFIVIAASSWRPGIAAFGLPLDGRRRARRSSIAAAFVGNGTGPSERRPPPPLSVEPYVLEAPIVIRAVVVQYEALQVRVPAGRRAIMIDDRSSEVLGQLALDLPHECLARRRVGLLGLPVDQRIHVLVAVLRVVALRVAAIVLIQIDIRVVDAGTGVVQANAVLLASNLGLPNAGVDQFELGFDMHALQLVDEDRGRITESRDVAGGYLHLEGLALAVAEPLHDRPALGTALLYVGGVARQRAQDLRRHSPRALGQR